MGRHEQQPAPRPAHKFAPGNARFSLAPLILAGAILITYAVLRPTASTQTLAAPPPTRPPAVALPVTRHAPSQASPAAEATHAVTAPSAGPVRPATSAPPARSGPDPVRPALLGAPAFDAYCQVTGQGTVQLVSANAYGWHCSADNGIGDDATAVCAWTYHRPVSGVASSVPDFYDPHTWQCWSVTRQIQPPDFSGYCLAAGHGAVQLSSPDAYGWHCADGSGIDAGLACEWTNRSTPVMVARFQNFYDSQSWQCWD
jgi:hypothetical protein